MNFSNLIVTYRLKIVGGGGYSILDRREQSRPQQQQQNTFLKLLA